MAGGSEQMELIGVEPSFEPDRPTEERTDAQRAAVAARDRDLFTEAGAGAGKTGVLVERYCDCVTEDEISPERILAFTFTERAAGELRERVHRELSARAWAAAERGDHLLAREIARAAREGERAWITTIHGFCRRLCAAHPVAAGMDPGFRVLDEAEAARLGERAFDAALEETVAGGDPAVARFAAAFQPRRLRAMVQAAHERLRSQGADPVRLPDPGPPARSAKGGEQDSELTPRETMLAERGFAAFDSLLTAYEQAFERLKAERSAADFEDLELRALDLLRRSGPVKEAWRHRFEHLMVDEFQDTNRVQLALIDALHGPQARLFCVGDEYQSIYRFRHADLEVFRERRRQARTDPSTEEISLRGNFRSRPEVLAAIDFVGGTLFGPEFRPLEAGLEHSGEPAGGRPVAELLVTADSEQAGDGSGWRAEQIDLAPPRGESNPASVAEARFLAERLRELADHGAPRREMVVLLRAFTHVDAFSDALERAGLAPYVVGGRGYWSQQQVEDALRLCAVIANPLDDEALFGALASPACEVSADALWLLRRAARDPDGRPNHVWPTIAGWTLPEAMSGDDVHRLARFRDILIALRAEAPLLALDALIDHAISAFDYDLSILSLPDGERRMANLRKLMLLAAEYERHEGRHLRGFLDFAEDRTRRDEREGMAAMQVEGRDGVRVMTVHAAKGLEFGVVAVADLGRTLGAGFRHPDVAIGRLSGALGDPSAARFGMRLPVAAGDSLRLWELVQLGEEEREAEVEESLRLLYVAASRARERLILSGIARHSKATERVEASPSTTVVELLLGALSERGWSGDDSEVALDPAPAVGGGAASGPVTPKLAVRVQRPSAERATALRRRWSPAGSRPAPPSPPPRPLLAGPMRPAPTGHLSYSALADYAGCGYRFYVERVLGLAAPLAADPGDASGPAEREPELDEQVDPALGARRRSLAIGNCVHGALESSARRAWARPPDDEIIAILAREGIADDAEARGRVETLLDNWLRSDLRRELHEGGARTRPEVPFVLGLGGAIVRGKIDLLAETDAEAMVVDYKTDALRGVDPGELADRYETQRDLYAVAIDRARAAGSNGPIRAAYCFLEAPEQTVIEDYDQAALEAASERLELLVAGIRAGEFARTESPHASLCHGCPAAARLCAKPAWRPQWAAAAATG